MKHSRHAIEKLDKALRKSPINYFSDLFVAVMVIAWIAVLLIMIFTAVYATIALSDTGVWGYVESLVTVPLSCGGALWMLKNSVQHAIANNRGELAHMDFPAVPDTEMDYEENTDEQTDDMVG